MKKNIIALAVASAIAAPVAMADAPTIYGKLNVNINSKTDGGSGVNDTASRIGVKGSEDLGNGLKAVYKLEWSLDVEGGDQDFGDRNQYLGLAGGFGTVLIGKHDSPLKMAQPTDVWNDGASDNGNLGLGYAGKTGEVRAANVLAYVSPSFSGVKLIAAGTSPAIGNADDRSIAGGTHAAVTYGSTKKGLFLSAAMDKFKSDEYGTTNNMKADEDYTQTSYAAQYKTGGLTVNGMIRKFDDGASDDADTEGTSTHIGAAYKMGKITFKAKMQQADYAKSGVKTGNQTAIGLAYSLGKKTAAYVYTTTQDKNLTTGALKKNFSDKTKSATNTFIGMVHKF